jgi:hypothetical protein
MWAGSPCLLLTSNALLPVDLEQCERDAWTPSYLYQMQSFSLNITFFFAGVYFSIF